MRESARALSELMAHQEQLHPPDRYRFAHAALRTALREEYVALTDYQSAGRGSDVVALRTAVSAYLHALESRLKVLEQLGLVPGFVFRRQHQTPALEHARSAG